MIYAEIIYIGKNKSGQDKIEFGLYNANSEMLNEYIEILEDGRKHQRKADSLSTPNFDIDDPYYLISRNIPLAFLARHNFIPISKDFFYTKD